MAILINGTFAADGDSDAATIRNPNNGASPFQCIYASGDFGGGTITVEISNDGGVTFYAATDNAGDVTLTDDGAVRTFLLGANNSTSTQQIKMRLSLAGASSPDIDYTIADAK